MKKKVLALVMDVAPLTRATISRAFQPADFEIVWTTNLAEATEAPARQPYDLLLLDLDLPLRTGWEIFERLRKLNSTPPVVLLTEHKSEYEEALGGQTGAVLQKPFSVAALIHAVHTLLGMPLPAVPAPSNRSVSPGDARAISEGFREMLYQRYTAPFNMINPTRHWGINE